MVDFLSYRYYDILYYNLGQEVKFSSMRGILGNSKWGIFQRKFVFFAIFDHFKLFKSNKVGWSAQFLICTSSPRGVRRAKSVKNISKLKLDFL